MYAYYGSLKYKDESHIQKICEGIFNNMADSQPLPVRFQAAVALEVILKIDIA